MTPETGPDMKLVYEPARTALAPDGFDFCPGCGYGSVVLALADIAATLPRPPVFIIDIGCVDFMTAHLPGAVMMGPHGRATALATGYKRVCPEATVCAIQGDGAFMGIGATESLHTAARGEPITVIVLNNGVLADTGGQMAATTLAGQVTTTTPAGRGPALGAPLPFLEMIAGLPGVTYAERVAIDSGPRIRGVGRALAAALGAQQAGAGLSVVEVVSPCPTHWRLDPVQAWDRVRDITGSAYPAGVLTDRRTGAGS
jgi:2-oxoglutarate/2-oxoacid ferredoxin oxidoreductase subunit beta